MPLYEYYCPPCGSQFEVLRPVSQMDNPAVCPSGHTTNNRVLSLFAPISKSSYGDVATATMPQMTAGDSCCGGSCSCC
jgi:putative FmdB family regulatory protein